MGGGALLLSALAWKLLEAGAGTMLHATLKEVPEEFQDLAYKASPVKAPGVPLPLLYTSAKSLLIVDNIDEETKQREKFVVGGALIKSKRGKTEFATLNYASRPGRIKSSYHLYIPPYGVIPLSEEQVTDGQPDVRQIGPELVSIGIPAPYAQALELTTPLLRPTRFPIEGRNLKMSAIGPDGDVWRVQGVNETTVGKAKTPAVVGFSFEHLVSQETDMGMPLLGYDPNTRLVTNAVYGLANAFPPDDISHLIIGNLYKNAGSYEERTFRSNVALYTAFYPDETY
jgi:hypothetical protein